MQGINDIPSTDSMLNNTGSPDNMAVIVAIVTVLVLVAIIVVTLLVIVIMCCKRRHESDRVHKLQSMVLETKEDEKEAESHMDYQYEIVDKNGVKTAASGATTVGALCSNPDKAITDDGYSHLRDSQKKKVPLRKWQQ